MTTHYRVRNDLQTPIMEGTLDEETGNFLENLRQKLDITVTALSAESIEFDLVGVDASIANALRRIMMAEVPTVAVENVWISENSGIIQDEILSHRIGLMPLKIDPSKIDYVVNGEEETDKDTLVFTLDAYFPSADNMFDPQMIAVNDKGHVTSGHFRWLPQGQQENMFPDGVMPVNDDIVLAKLRPGQRIQLEAHARYVTNE